jgi:hypothetical protein
MKLVIMSLLMVFALSAQAINLGDLLPILIGGSRPAPYPGNPYPGHPEYPNQPYPGQPNYPGYCNVTCRADDNGYEEHGGGHYSCDECLSYHGECTETCNANCIAQQVRALRSKINFVKSLT